MDECSRLQNESRMDDQHGHSQGFYFSIPIASFFVEIWIFAETPGCGLATSHRFSISIALTFTNNDVYVFFVFLCAMSALVGLFYPYSISFGYSIVSE